MAIWFSEQERLTKLSAHFSYVCEISSTNMYSPNVCLKKGRYCSCARFKFLLVIVMYADNFF